MRDSALCSFRRQHDSSENSKSSQAKKPRTRTSQPKVRTGCQTCKYVSGLVRYQWELPLQQQLIHMNPSPESAVRSAMKLAHHVWCAPAREGHATTSRPLTMREIQAPARLAPNLVVRRLMPPPLVDQSQVDLTITKRPYLDLFRGQTSSKCTGYMVDDFLAACAELCWCRTLRTRSLCLWLRVV
jgi:hypothetical protein